MWTAHCCVLLFNIGVASGLLCFNCSATQQDWNYCGGEFGNVSPLPFNSTKLRLINCTEENAMCFVRSWSARAKHAWLVQRGCYHASKDDLLPRSLLTPTRAMACKRERLIDAEYTVCLCQADWCNSAVSNFYHKTIRYLKNASVVFVNIFVHYLYTF